MYFFMYCFFLVRSYLPPSCLTFILSKPEKKTIFNTRRKDKEPKNRLPCQVNRGHAQWEINKQNPQKS